MATNSYCRDQGNKESHDESLCHSATIDDVLSCPVCLELFVSPKVMPNCGHTVCLDCLSKIVSLSADNHRVACPECRVVSPLGHAGVHGLRTNIQLQRTVALYENSTQQRDSSSAEAGSRSVDSFHDTCPHVFLTKAPLTCEHCSTKFCSGCGVAHMEKMKLELVDLVKSFPSRLETSQLGLDEHLKYVQVELDSQLDTSKSEISQVLDSLLKQIVSLIEEARTGLVQKAETAKAAKWFEIGEVVKEGLKQDADLENRVCHLSTKSVLNCGIEDIAALYADVSRRNEALKLLEKFRSNPLDGKVNITFDENIESVVLATLRRLKTDRVKWQSFIEIDSEQARDSTNQVHDAVRAADVSTLRRVLSKKPEFIEGIDDGMTPLMCAAKLGQIEVCRCLVREFNTDLRASGLKRGVSAIHLACQNGHIITARYLLCEDIGLLRLRNYAGATPLAYAVHHGHSNVVEMLIDEFGADVEEHGVAGKTPLMEAASKGVLQVVQLLINRRADLYARQPKTGNIAAHLAAKDGSAEALRLMLEQRPDLLIVKNYKGQTPIDVANDAGVVRLLEERGSRRRASNTFEF